jgi:hypothetical protein
MHKMISSIFLIIASAVLSASVTIANAQTGDNVGSDFVMATSNQALKSIKSAEAAGADVSELVIRFNVALDLQRQAERDNYDSCTSYDQCIINANDMMLAIVEEATLLGKQATAKNEQANVMTFTVYVPLGSFAASILIVSLYRAWQSRRAKSYQGMDIHQRSAS